MKLTAFWLFCVATAPLLPGMAWAQSGTVREVSATGADPSDMYLQAWSFLSAAEKSAGKRDYMAAVKQLREGEQILAAIAKDRPEWKTNMVAFRRQKNTELLEKWTQLAKEQAAKVPVTPPPVEKQPAPTSASSRNPTPPVRPVPSIPAGNQPTYESMNSKAGRPSIGGIERPYGPPALPEQGESSYDRLNRELMRSQAENRALIKALQQTRKELEDALVRKVEAESGEVTYKSMLADLRASIEKERATGNELLVNLTARLNEAESKLKTAEQEKKNVQSELDRLKQRLQEMETQLAEVSQENAALEQERDMLKKDRDQLAAILELNSPEKTKNLLDRNLTLVAQLKEAQHKIQHLESENLNSEDQKAANLRELERTREESAKIKISLAALMDENVGYRRRITELNNQLTNSEAELAKMAKLPKADPISIEENKLLRSTVSKQLILISNQLKSRDLMMEAYKRLKLQDPAMIESIKMLGNTELCELTPEEKKLAESISSQNIASPEKENSIRVELDNAGKSAREEQERMIRKQLESEALGKAALASFEKGRFAAAEQLYRTLLDDQPDLFPARVNMATILLKRNLVEEAITHLDKAIRIEPESSPANFLLGVAYYRAGNDKQAVSSFLETVRIQPDNVQAYIYLGNIESSAGHADKAVEYYDKALAIKSSMPDVLFNKASTLAKSGKLNEARKAYDLSIREGSLPDPELERLLTSTEPSKQENVKEKANTPPAPSRKPESPAPEAEPKPVPPPPSYPSAPPVSETKTPPAPVKAEPAAAPSRQAAKAPPQSAPEAAPKAPKSTSVKTATRAKIPAKEKDTTPVKKAEAPPANAEQEKEKPRNRRFRIG